MPDFVTDDTAQLGIHLFLALSVAHTAEVEVGAVADVKLVFVRPAGEAVILIGDFHGGIMIR